ncbi:MAG: DUF1275 domain-containing protein [Deltaproteobacteria bacterium]|nr:DUF1275 domain-containing protein [Deltaproteobacteria bacterium]
MRAEMRISERNTTAVLSGVAGFVDIAGFIALFGMFTAHVTGNLVAFVGVVADPTAVGAVARLAMLPVFMTSVAVAALLTRTIRRRGGAPLRPLLTLMAMALAGFCLAGGAFHCAARVRHDWVVTVVAGIGTAAMGVQNTIMRDILKRHSPTTLMTGNLTTFTIELTDILLPTHAGDLLERARNRQRLAASGTPLACFLVGAIVGGCLTSLVGLWSIAVPAVCTGVLSYASQKGARKIVVKPLQPPGFAKKINASAPSELAPLH